MSALFFCRYNKKNSDPHGLLFFFFFLLSAELFFEFSALVGEADIRKVDARRESAVVKCKYRARYPAFGVELFAREAEYHLVKLEHLRGELRHVGGFFFLFECHFDEDILMRAAHDGSAVFVTRETRLVSCQGEK